MDYKSHKVDPKSIQKHHDKKDRTFEQNDLAYMSSLSAAVLQKTPTNTRIQFQGPLKNLYHSIAFSFFLYRVIVLWILAKNTVR